MTKKELKEAIYKVCDIIDNNAQHSQEYKEALKKLKELQIKMSQVRNQKLNDDTLVRTKEGLVF